MRRWRMALGRPKAELVVTATEREVLEQWARRPKTPQALAQRVRIVLAGATGAANTAVAARIGVTPQMVGKSRAPFFTRRLAGLLDAPRPGAPRRITDAQVEAVVRDTLEATPRDDTHWSTRAMAAARRRSGAYGTRSRSNGTALRRSSSPRTRSSPSVPGRRTPRVLRQ